MTSDHPQDHFSGVAAGYAQARPRYPQAWFVWLGAQVGPGAVAWDCATGSGQAAVALAPYVRQVIASDLSAAQLAHAEPHPRVAYRQGTAEAAPLDDQSVDLVTVAQALHWFDLPAFYDEVHRVLRPGGLLAVWSYGLHEIAPAVDRVVAHYYEHVVGPYWPPERRVVESGYRALDFPFAPVPDVPAVAMTARWTVGDLLAYLGTWSAGVRYCQAHGRDPLNEVAAELRAAWGDADAVRDVSWPLAVRVGRRD